MNKLAQEIKNLRKQFDKDRDIRRKETAEVFTPPQLVNEMLDKLEESDPDAFTNPERTFCDPACGDGNFLFEVLIRKIQNGIDAITALQTIYGVDIMKDNVSTCRKILCIGAFALSYRYRKRHRKKTKEFVDKCKEIVRRNIVCDNSLDYDFDFTSDSSQV